jgi:hypothetical protein
MGCLLVEASAKMAVGVTKAFNEAVVRIIDMSSLWHHKPKSSGRAAASGPPRHSREYAGEFWSEVEEEDTLERCLC